VIELAEASAASSALVQVLPSAATVVVALITGFGAASVKHRWDSEADDRRWQREGAARARTQRLSAFAQYLAARPSLEAVRSFAGQSKEAAIVVSAARLAAANLLILLPEPGQRDIVESDLRTVQSWVDAWLSSRADRTDVPPVDAILDLARALAAEPEEKADGYPRRGRWRRAARRGQPSWRSRAGPPDDAPL
jgi:hypothetical protein